nr:DUF4179 domain-containing protein [Bacillus suaedaesalsae]
MNDVTNRVQETERGIREEKRRVQKKRTKVSVVLASIVTLAIVVGFVTNGFSYFYYSWLEWRQLEDEEMLTYLKNGVGERLNIESEHNGIKITFKTAVSDDYQTLIFYDIEAADDKKYAISQFDGMSVENDYEIFNMNTNYMYSPTKLQSIDKGENVFSGVLSLSPLVKESGIINLKLSKLLEVIEDPDNKEGTMIDTFQENRLIDGEWSFTIPVTKEASIEYELSNEMELDGFPIIMEKITFAPTTTLLQYRVNTSFQESKKQIHDVHIKKLERGNKEAINQNYYAMHDEDSSYVKSFDQLYFERSKEFTIHFSSINYSVEDPVSFNLNLEEKFPQTFHYLGNPITIEKVTIDQPTKIMVTDAPPQDREYESLQFDLTREQAENQIDMGFYGSHGVWVDREGNEIDPSDYNYFNASDELPRYYQTNYEIELFKKYSDGEIIPNKLQINGYNTTKYLDEVVNIQFEEGGIQKK